MQKKKEMFFGERTWTGIDKGHLSGVEDTPRTNVVATGASVHEKPWAPQRRQNRHLSIENGNDGGWRTVSNHKVIHGVRWWTGICRQAIWGTCPIHANTGNIKVLWLTESLWLLDKSCPFWNRSLHLCFCVYEPSGWYQVFRKNLGFEFIVTTGSATTNSKLKKYEGSEFAHPSWGSTRKRAKISQISAEERWCAHLEFPGLDE